MTANGVTRGRILLVEDEEHLAAGIAENLEAEGYRVEVSGDGGAGLRLMMENRFDLVVLDVMLPEIDGFTICETARAKGVSVPVLFLTAKGRAEDRIRGLRLGADDYLTKPFHLEELLLRVGAIVRRTAQDDDQSSEELRFGGNLVDLGSYRALAWNGREHELTHKEAMILKTLVEREGQVVSRDDILDRVWGLEMYPTSRTIDNFIVRLRKRFERSPDEPKHFHTVRGVGYRFTLKPDERPPP